VEKGGGQKGRRAGDCAEKAEILIEIRGENEGGAAGAKIAGAASRRICQLHFAGRQRAVKST